MKNAIAMLLAVCLMVGCSSEKATQPPRNNPPNTPTAISPVNGATDQENSLTLTWSCTDPEDDSLFYEVYFGTSSSPPLVRHLLKSDTTYPTGQIANNTLYYWRIVAVDSPGGSTASPVWRFATVGNRPPSAPTDPEPPDSAIGRELGLAPLSWTCTDPDGDSLFYDLYFDTSSIPALGKSGLPSSSYSPTGLDWFYQLDYHAKYYWQVVAKDGKGGETMGPVWNLTTHREIILVGTLKPSGYTTAVEVSGNYAFIINDGRVLSVDISNPSAPRTLYALSLTGANDLDVDGDYAYVGRRGLLQILNISNPSNFYSVGTASTLGSWLTWKVLANDGYVYLSTMDSGATSTHYVEVFDVSVPSAPIRVAAITHPNIAYDLAIAGNYLYIADGRDGAVYDITDPASPVLVTNSLIARNWDALFIDGTAAYGARENNLDVADLSNPASAVLLGDYQPERNLPLIGRRVVKSGDLVYVASYSYSHKGVVVVNVTDPTEPVLEARYSVSSSFGPNDIEVAGEMIFLPAREMGLLMLRVIR